MKVVLDSNVLISVLNLNDSSNLECVELIEKLKADGYEVLAPALYLWEMDAYIRHTEKSKTHQENTKTEFKLSVVDVTHGLYFRTYSMASANISGADRVFVSLARDHNVPLVTRDDRVLRDAHLLGANAVSVIDFLACAP